VSDRWRPNTIQHHCDSSCCRSGFASFRPTTLRGRSTGGHSFVVGRSSTVGPPGAIVRQIPIAVQPTRAGRGFRPNGLQRVHLNAVHPIAPRLATLGCGPGVAPGV
jgi:hypothetical protein